MSQINSIVNSPRTHRNSPRLSPTVLANRLENVSSPDSPLIDNQHLRIGHFTHYMSPLYRISGEYNLKPSDASRIEEIILANPEHINLPGPDGMTPLLKLGENYSYIRHKELVDVYLRHGADVDFKNPFNGMTPLLQAIIKASLDTPERRAFSGIFPEDFSESLKMILRHSKHIPSIGKIRRFMSDYWYAPFDKNVDHYSVPLHPFVEGLILEEKEYRKTRKAVGDSGVFQQKKFGGTVDNIMSFLIDEKDMEKRRQMNQFKNYTEQSDSLNMINPTLFLKGKKGEKKVKKSIKKSMSKKSKKIKKSVKSKKVKKSLKKK